MTRAIAALAGVLEVFVALLVACGPISAPPERYFVVIVHNADTLPDDVTIRWARGGSYLGSETRTIPAGGFATVVTTRASSPPDLVEIASSALNTAWGPPDWSGHDVFHIDFPKGQTWTGPP